MLKLWHAEGGSRRSSLTELLVVIASIAILAAMLLPAL
jgi:Tfp pilus assembly protein FimT